jgi:hypothetical protein
LLVSSIEEGILIQGFNSWNRHPIGEYALKKTSLSRHPLQKDVANDKSIIRHIFFFFVSAI